MTARLELLRRRLGQKTGRTAQAGAGAHYSGAISPRRDAGPVQLSAAQHRMWLHQQLHPESSAYNVSIRLDFRGDVDETRLLLALDAVVARHEVLRSTYRCNEDGTPQQHIHDDLPPTVIRLKGRPAEDVANEAAKMPFDLAKFSPVRVHLLRVDTSHLVLILTVHHIVWDGACFGLFCEDLSRAYRGLEPQPLSLQYADFAAQEAAAPADAYQHELIFWKDRLEPLPRALPLPARRLTRPDGDDRAERTDRWLPHRCATALRALADRLNVTPFSVFTAAYALLLRQWSGCDDVTIATMVANRHQPGAGAPIGNFGNTVLLRVALNPSDSFARLIENTQVCILDAVGHCNIPFEALVEDIKPPRAAGHGFFTDTLGLFLDRDIEGPDLPGIEVTWENIFNGASPFILTFQGFLTGGRLKVEVSHRNEMFDRSTIDQMLDHLEEILIRADHNPDLLCADVGALPRDQRANLLSRSEGPETDAGPDTILDYWRASVAEAPQQTAVICGSQALSRAEADTLTNRMAHALLASGLKPEAPVAVALSRCIEASLMPLAIWKAGGIYVPLNPDHPPARLAMLLAETGASCLIAAEDSVASVDLGIEAILSPAEVAVDKTLPDMDPRLHLHPQSGALVCFTSGSTGHPKAVLITHANLVARTSWVAEHWPSSRDNADPQLSARLCKSPPTSIDATAELCEAWASGDVVVFADSKDAGDAVRLGNLLTDQSIAHVMAVPGLLGALATACPVALQNCNRVLSTGEPLLAQVAQELSAEAPGVRLYNAYGCTETTGDVLAGAISPEYIRREDIPVGRPLPGSCCYVLTQDLRLSPQDVLGELYVSTGQLARGYLGQTGLTASRFVANPFEPGARLYRTGDLARWRPDGRLELAGRSDDQVNVRGHRVEPSETQAALLAQDGVTEAAVLPRAKGSTSELVAYVAGTALLPEDAIRLKSALMRQLPGQMIPAEILILAKLPRLGGGKIDRRSLLEQIQPAKADVNGRKPESPAEKTLVAILADLLGRECIGVEDNFFALGGDSMLALTLAARANAAGMPLTAAAVFQYPTISELAAQLPQNTGHTPQAVLQTAEPRSVALPLAPVVHRFRLAEEKAAVKLAWHALRQTLPPESFAQRLHALVTDHPHLNRRLSRRGRLWRLREPSGEPRAQVISSETAQIDVMLRDAGVEIDLNNGLGVVGVCSPSLCLIAAHPAVLDGWGLTAAVARVEGDPQPEYAFSALSPKPLGADHWQKLLRNGPDDPWWVTTEAPLATGGLPPVHLGTGLAGTLSDADILQSFAATLLRLSSAGQVIVDLEQPEGDLGPLSTVPVSLQSSAQSTIGTAQSYMNFCQSNRPVAGGAGVLVRVGASLQQPEQPVSGAEALYRLVAGWQRVENGQLTLSLRGTNPDEVQALMSQWCISVFSEERVGEPVRVL